MKISIAMLMVILYFKKNSKIAFSRKDINVYRKAPNSNIVTFSRIKYVKHLISVPEK